MRVCSPRNQSLVPKRLGITVRERPFLDFQSPEGKGVLKPLREGALEDSEPLGHVADLCCVSGPCTALSPAELALAFLSLFAGRPLPTLAPGLHDLDSGPRASSGNTELNSPVSVPQQLILKN